MANSDKRVKAQDNSGLSQANDILRIGTKSRYATHVQDQAVKEAEQAKEQAIHERDEAYNAMTRSFVEMQDGTHYHIESGVLLDNKGIDFPYDLRPDQFNVFAEALVAFYNKMQLWMGDLVNYAKEHYKSKISELAAAFNLSEATIEQYAYVCQRVPYDVRQENLSYSHYRLVIAARWNDQRADILRHASDEEMTVDDLFKYIEELKGEQDTNVSDEDKEREHISNITSAKIQRLREDLETAVEQVESGEIRFWLTEIEKIAAALRNRVNNSTRVKSQ